MKSSFEKLPGSLIELSVEIPLEDLKRAVDAEFEHARKGLELKGFRKGMVPEALAREAISPKKLFDAAAETLVKQTLHEVAESNDWTIVDRPIIEIKDDANSFSYSARFPILPVPNVDGWEKAADAERQALAKRLEKLSVTGDEVAQAIDWLREARAKLEPSEKPSEKGMVIDLELSSSIGDKPMADRFILGKGRFMPGLEEHLVGRRAGETATFSLTAPPDYWKEDLRGKELSFTAKIKGVFDRIIPELDDAFAATAGKFKAVSELETSVKGGILAEKKEKEGEAACIRILEAIVEKAAIDIPASMLERVRRNGAKEDDAALKRKLAMHLVIHSLAEKTDAHPSNEEVEEALAIDPTVSRDYIYERIQQQRLYAKLLGSDGN